MNCVTPTHQFELDQAIVVLDGEFSKEHGVDVQILSQRGNVGIVALANRKRMCCTHLHRGQLRNCVGQIKTKTLGQLFRIWPGCLKGSDADIDIGSMSWREFWASLIIEHSESSEQCTS